MILVQPQDSSQFSGSPSLSPRASACSQSACASCRTSLSAYPAACSEKQAGYPCPEQTGSIVDPVVRFVGALHAYERLLRSSYAAGANLANAAIEAQVQRNLSPTTGHQILHSLTNANLAVTDALSRSAQAHRLLEILGRQLGLDISAYGDVHQKPSELSVPGLTGAEGSYADVAA